MAASRCLLAFTVCVIMLFCIFRVAERFTVAAGRSLRRGLSIRQIRGPGESVPAPPGSVTQRPGNNSGWPRRVGLKIGSQESPS